MQSQHDFISRTEQEDTTSAQLERCEGGSSAAGSQHPGQENTSETELSRYDDEEIATKPWPPLDS